MRHFRNQVVIVSVILSIALCGLLYLVSPVAATGFALGSSANMVVAYAWIRSLDLEEKSPVGIKSLLFYWGFIRLAVYAAVFYIAYKLFSEAPGAGITGVAGGLLVPLAVMAVVGATGLNSKETSD